MIIIGNKNVKSYVMEYLDNLADNEGVAAFWNFSVKDCYRKLDLGDVITYTTFTGWYKEWGNSRFGAE